MLPSLLLVIFALIFWQSTLYLRRRRASKGLPLPPGPKGWPIIGNILDFPKEYAWKRFVEWGSRYGDLICVNMLGQTVIIINSSRIARDLLEKRGSIYSSRPPIPHMDLMGITSWSVGFKAYSHIYKAERKVAEQSLRPRATTAYFPMQTSRTHQFLRNLVKDPEAYVRHIRHFSTAIIMSVAYGYELGESDVSDRYVDLAEEVIKRGLVGLRPTSPVNIMPILKHLPARWPGMGWKTFAEETASVSHKMVNDPFNFVKTSIKNGTARPSLSRDGLMSCRNEPTKEEETQIKNVAATLYSAAVDSYVALFSSLFLALVLHPEMQQKAQDEIDSVIGQERLPSYEDRPRLPFCEAFSKEMLRWRPVATLGIPHATTEDDVYEGYFIPKGSHVFANSWAILHNPEHYPDPETFRPERFLTASGEFKNDPELASAFGFGRRVCVGRHFADTTIWILVVSVLATLTIGRAKDEDGNEIPVEDVFTGDSGLVNCPLPFQCSISPRGERARELIKTTDAQ